MNKFLKIFFIALMVFIFLPENLFRRMTGGKIKKFKDVKTKIKFDNCKRTFKDIAGGFNYSNLSQITIYFEEQVYLNIISSDKGYYSSSQAEIILDEFMSYFRVISFKYKRSYYKNSFAFAVGKYKYDIGGGSRELEVSISLRYDGESWSIDQITIN